MLLKTKFKLLGIFVIVNICGYIIGTGSMKNMFHAPVRKDVPRNVPVAVGILHNGVISTNQHSLFNTSHTEIKPEDLIKNLSENNFRSIEELDTNYKVDANTQKKIEGSIKIQDDVKLVDNKSSPVLYAVEQLINQKNNGRDRHTQKEHGILNSITNFMNGESNPLENPHDFNYLINEPNKCKHEDGSDMDVFFLVLICSVHANFEKRDAIRTSWGSPTEINGKNIKTMFLLAKKSDQKLQNVVLEESMQYHDILMEDFDDTYKNLTLKTMMGFKWATNFCPQARFVMKTDDDMYVSYANIISHVSAKERSRFAMGMVIKGSPIRDPKSKWYMPKNLYPNTKYPPFMSGTGYVLSGDVVSKVYGMSLHTPYLYLEDVYCAICLDKLHIVPENHKAFNNWRTSYTYCKFKRIMTAHMITPTEMKRYWKDQKTEKLRC